MNRALIFAGGKGTRMHIGDRPKQFLEIDNKAIIIYTLEKFQECDLVDDIVVVCVGGWEDYLAGLISKNDMKLTKVSKILTGGETGFSSRIIGLEYIKRTSADPENDLVLIHDGVRPLISSELLKDNVKCALQNGNAITTASATETVVVVDNGLFLERSSCFFARAPQTFRVNDIYNAYKKASLEGKDCLIDSASIANYYGIDLHYVNGPNENIKITTINDYYLAKGIIEYLNKDLGND